MMVRSALLPVVVTAALFCACSDFNRAMKSTDKDFKLATAEKYFEAGKFDRALPLLEELVAITRGSGESERVNYLLAKSYFGMKDYILGAYYLANFTRTFPKSAYAEECAFLTAYCHYRNSPHFELEQTETISAIEQLQLFLVRYPNSSLRDSCNTLIDRLRGKLEKKAWHAAVQYHHMRHYQAASVALKSFLREWPNTGYREEALLLILRSDHSLAMNSVEERRVERLREAVRSYHNFADAYPNSPRSAEAERLHKDLIDALEQATASP